MPKNIKPQLCIEINIHKKYEVENILDLQQRQGKLECFIHGMVMTSMNGRRNQQ